MRSNICHNFCSRIDLRIQFLLQPVTVSALTTFKRVSVDVLAKSLSRVSIATCAINTEQRITYRLVIVHLHAGQIASPPALLEDHFSDRKHSKRFTGGRPPLKYIPLRGSRILAIALNLHLLRIRDL